MIVRVKSPLTPLTGTLMLTLTQFLLILISLLCREVSWPEDAGAGLQPLLAITAYCLGFGLLTKMICLSSLRLREASTTIVERALERWHVIRQGIEALWVICLPAALLLTSWGPWISQLEKNGFPQSLSVLLWFTPSLVFLLMQEIVASQLEVFVQEFKSASGLAVHKQDTESKFFDILSTRIRLGGTSSVVTCLLPVLLIATSSDLIAPLNLGLQTWQTSLIASLIGLSCVALFLPQMVAGWMGVRKLPNSILRDRIAGFCKALGLRVEPMWVASNGRWGGAAVIGWLPGFRQLWLGDALVSRLNDEELDMVIMHELAHLRRHHFLWRILPVITAACVGLSVTGLLTSIIQLVSIQDPTELAPQTCGMLAGGAVMLYGLSKWSRHCELDADRQACLLGAMYCLWAHNDPSLAADQLASALLKLHHRSAEEDRATWLHPALGQRLAELQLIALPVETNGAVTA